MTWWQDRFRSNDTDIPPELRDKKPEDIVKALKEAQKMSEDFEASKTKTTELEGKLTTQANEFEAMKQKLASIEAGGGNGGGGGNNGGGNGGGDNGGGGGDDPPSVWTDPEKFVDSRIQGTALVALQSGRMVARMSFEQSLGDRDRKIFKKYADEIEKGVLTFAPAAQVMPQSYMNMFFHTKGLHENDIRKAEQEKTDFFAEPVTRGGAPNDGDGGDVKLSPEEEETCRVMHFDPVKYLENKKNITVSQSSKGAYANFKVPKPVSA